MKVNMKLFYNLQEIILVCKKDELNLREGEKMERYKVSNECVGCRACVSVAENNFGIKNSLAYVKKQPLTKEEESLCQNALKVCPVNAISKVDEINQANVVVTSSNTEGLSWDKKKEGFYVIDAREINHDPFDVIMKKAYEIKEDDGFVLIQRFEPYPIINMLSEMGFKYETVKKSNDEFRIYFYKKLNDKVEEQKNNSKVDVVIQSATPVAHPVIMKLLQSERIKKAINIKELKVWKDTEKHLAWITNRKADISFSAIITAAKLKNSDIKIPALFVWDNFVLLSRKKIKGFEDLVGEKIYAPLFEEAPPAKITKYLIKASGLNPDDFNFVYGKPFGRPEQIYKDFVEHKADNVILREPEASYAIKIMQDRKEDISVISYNKLWNKVNPGFGMFPNAGVIFKGEFVKEHPNIAKMFTEELKKAIEWIKNNRQEAVKLSFDVMQQPENRVELFLNRVNFQYIEGNQLVEKVKQYFDILNKNGIADVKIDKEFIEMFKLGV